MTANLNNIFLENYQGIVDKLCEEHNLPHHDVFFSYRLSRVLGRVCMTKTKTFIVATGETKNVMTYKIILNLKFIALNNFDAILEVIRHELAHTKAGAKNNHNAIFKKVCREMGNTNPMGVTTLHTSIGKYVYECPVCGKTITRSKSLRRPHSCLCAGGDRYNDKYRFVCINKLINTYLKQFKKYVKKKYNVNLNEVFTITKLRNL